MINEKKEEIIIKPDTYTYTITVQINQCTRNKWIKTVKENIPVGTCSNSVLFTNESHHEKKY